MTYCIQLLAVLIVQALHLKRQSHPSFSHNCASATHKVCEHPRDAKRAISETTPHQVDWAVSDSRNMIHLQVIARPGSAASSLWDDCKRRQLYQQNGSLPVVSALTRARQRATLRRNITRPNLHRRGQSRKGLTTFRGHLRIRRRRHATAKRLDQTR